jgi:hypothetical protein
MENDVTPPDEVVYTAPAPQMPTLDPLDLGDSAPMPLTELPAGLPNQQLVEAYRQTVVARISQCSSKREILEVELDSLSECVGIAAEIFQRFPVPDNAYMLSALQNAKNSSLSQLEKMKDPKIILADLEGQIKNMFTNLIKSMITEIDKTKKEFTRIHPDSKATIEDQFNRMITSLAPETNKLYDGLHQTIKTTLGIKR